MAIAPGTQEQFMWASEAEYGVREDCMKDKLKFLLRSIYAASSN